MDPIWIIIAFGLGWAARQARLPPLLGFLATGFVLGAYGVKGGVVLDEVADLGVWLLLFAIGLKLKLGQLKRPEVLVVATVHMGFIVVLGTGVLLGLGTLGGAVSCRPRRSDGAAHRFRPGLLEHRTSREGS